MLPLQFSAAQNPSSESQLQVGLIIMRSLDLIKPARRASGGFCIPMNDSVITLPKTSGIPIVMPVKSRNRGIATTDGGKLARQGERIAKCLKATDANASQRILGSPQIAERYHYEIERFRTWANSLGLHHREHSSLDYRLRESTTLSDYINGLLEDLQQALELCKNRYLAYRLQTNEEKCLL